LIGTWKAFPTVAILAGIGIVVGVAYTLRALQKAFLGETTSRVPSEHEHSLPPISLPEKVGAVILMATSLAVGLYPKCLMEMIHAGLQSPMFNALLKAGGGM
jgi:NADH-quinone oxidoreductase subunit M